MLETTAGCSECDRLWQQYKTITHHTLQLESKLQIATLAHDSDTVMKLVPAVQELAERRDGTRQELCSTSEQRTTEKPMLRQHEQREGLGTGFTTSLQELIVWRW